MDVTHILCIKLLYLYFQPSTYVDAIPLQPLPSSCSPFARGIAEVLKHDFGLAESVVLSGRNAVRGLDVASAARCMAGGWINHQVNLTDGVWLLENNCQGPVLGGVDGVPRLLHTEPKRVVAPWCNYAEGGSVQQPNWLQTYIQLRRVWTPLCVCDSDMDTPCSVLHSCGWDRVPECVIRPSWARDIVDSHLTANSLCSLSACFQRR